MCVPCIFYPFATSNHESCAMGITQSMRTDSIPTSVGVRRALISQLLFCLFSSLSQAHLPVSPQRTTDMCWIWLIDDTSTFFRPAGTYRAGTCMLSNRKITIRLQFFFICRMWDGSMSNRRGEWGHRCFQDYTLQFLTATQLDNPVKQEKTPKAPGRLPCTQPLMSATLSYQQHWDQLS